MVLHILRIVLLLMITSGIALAQQTDVEKLTADSFAALSAGRFEDAILLSKKVVTLQRAAKPANLHGIAIATKNLVEIRIEYYRWLRERIFDSKIEDKLKGKLRDVQIKQTEQILSESATASRIFDTLPTPDLPRSAELKFNVAVFSLGRFYASQPNLAETSDPRSLQGLHGEKIKRVIELLGQAFLQQKNSLGVSSNECLNTQLYLFHAYTISAEYDLAMRAADEYSSAVEVRYGREAKLLIPVFRFQLRFFHAIGNTTAVDQLRARIEKISGQKESSQPAPLDVFHRSDVSPSYVANLLLDSFSKVAKGFDWLLLRVVFDEKGTVVEVAPGDTQLKDVSDKAMAKKAVEEIKSWKFKPVLIDGRPTRFAGSVWYPFPVTQ